MPRPHARLQLIAAAPEFPRSRPQRRCQRPPPQRAIHAHAKGATPRELTKLASGIALPKLRERLSNRPDPLGDPLFVFNQRKADKTLAPVAEADTRRGCDLCLGDEKFRELE